MLDILKGVAIRDLKEQKLVSIITKKYFIQKNGGTWQNMSSPVLSRTSFTDQVLLMPYKVFEDWNNE